MEATRRPLVSREATQQRQQMMQYILSCQSFFEKFITELLLEQPDDPHAFLLTSLKKLAPTEVDELKQSVAKSTDPPRGGNAIRSSTREEKRPGTSSRKQEAQVVLNLTLVDGDEKARAAAKTAAYAILSDIKKAATDTSACLRYDYFYDADEHEIVVLHTWANQASLDTFYASAVYRNVAPRWKGVLAEPVREKVYQRD